MKNSASSESTAKDIAKNAAGVNSGETFFMSRTSRIIGYVIIALCVIAAGALLYVVLFDGEGGLNGALSLFIPLFGLGYVYSERRFLFGRVGFDQDGVFSVGSGLEEQRLNWDELKEIGVARHRGFGFPVYWLYFSKHKLDKAQLKNIVKARRGIIRMLTVQLSDEVLLALGKHIDLGEINRNAHIIDREKLPEVLR